MEVKLDPSLIDAINKAKAKPDWRAIAQRIAALEGVVARLKSGALTL